MRPLRIGVNALYMIPGGVGGTEIYLRNLLSALTEHDRVNEYFVFTNAETGRDLKANAQILPQNVRATNRPWRLIFEQTKLPGQVRDLRLDCLFNPGFTAPVITACPNITVFHDLQHKRHPEHFRTLDLPAWNLFLWAAVRRSRMLVAVSEATKADIIQYYGVPEDGIRVVHSGVDREFFQVAEQRGESERFILCSSTLHPHKNIERLIRAFQTFRETHPDYRLVITGVRGFQTEAVEKLISELGGGDSVELTGWIAREKLYDLFRRAHAFIYPSTFEGFGLPVVEAMAAGIPLACSDIEPLRSLTGEGALRFDPGDTGAIVNAMHRLTTDQELRHTLCRAGRLQAAQFTWDACARATLEAIVIGADPRAESSHQSSRRDT